MVVFPNAKINLGLHILRKRTDGFHDLATVFYPVGWKDALEVVEGGKEAFKLTISGLEVSGDPESNLCYKAWKLISADYKLPNLQAHLHKVIPMGAGLGGGSSDAAFMLKLINDVAGLKLAEEKLMKYASQLGSDCAFFIQNRPAYATGRGEILNDFEGILKGYYIVVLMPDITVPTAAAYSWITPKDDREHIPQILKGKVSTWRELLVNDFEKPVCTRHTQIAELIAHLYSKGALYAAMSGSGAAVFGVFSKETKIDLPEVNSWSGLAI